MPRAPESPRPTTGIDPQFAEDGDGLRYWTPFDGLTCGYARFTEVATDPQPPEERDALHARSPQRQQQSAAARAVARRALVRAGLPAQAIAVHDEGWPVFPDGVVGSLTHSRQAAAAVVASRQRWRAVGVDLEPQLPLPDDIAELVVDARERATIDALPGGWAVWSRVVFGAKECVHKCVHPSRGAWLEFDEVRISLQPEGRFVAEPLSAAARRVLAEPRSGAFCRVDGHLMCVMGLPAEDGPG